MLPVVIKDKVAQNIQEEYAYLEKEEIGLGEKLLNQIDEYLEIIEINPYIFKSGYRQVRQVRVKPFKYLLRYKVYKDFIAVIQLIHGKKHPKKRRVN
jgi:toxin ParE1/3/4